MGSDVRGALSSHARHLAWYAFTPAEILALVAAEWVGIFDFSKHTTAMLAIRSRDRASGSSSDFRIKLNQPVHGTWVLAHALIPNSSYNARLDNNRLRVQVGDSDPRYVLVDIGHHTAETLVQRLEFALRQQVHDGFRVQMVALTGRLRIYMLENQYFRLLLAGLEHSLAKTIGFAAADTVSAPQLESDFLVDLTGDHLTFNIVVDAPGTSFGLVNTHGHHSTFLVPNEENSLEYCSYNARARFPQCVLFRSPTRELHISLKDADHRGVDLNGADWHMLWRRAYS